MNKIISIFIYCSVAAAVLSSGCTSPLDIDSPRKVTPLEPAPKVTPRSVNVDFKTIESEYVFVNQPTFLVDTTVSPMRFWIEFAMGTVADSTPPLIQAFRIKLDSVPGDGYFSNLTGQEAKMSYDRGNGLEEFDCDLNVNTASIVIAESASEAGTPREVVITLYLIANKDGSVPVKQEQILGTIRLIL